MNSAVKASIFMPSCIIRAACFHSTTALERKRRNFWDSSRSNNNYSKRSRKMHAKQAMLRNVNAYADYLFQSWRKDFDEEDDPFSSRGPSWFRREYSKGPRRDRTGNQGPRHCGRRGSRFCEDDEDDIEIETIFRAAFVGNRFCYWSFVNEDDPHWGRSSSYTYNRGNSWRWRFEYTEDDDFSTEHEIFDPEMASNRMALGLSASGPLKLEDVKNAYRACAKKWHPDWHHGSSKAAAEEKFKLCSAAYQSLCDKLAVD